MKKDIYKEIPENFHRQFCRTLQELEDTSVPCEPEDGGRRAYAGTKKRKRKKATRRKYGIFLAAAILVCGCVTVAAAGLMGWHKRMSTRFGTDKALEDKLTSEQVAIPQASSVEKDGLKFQALQAVRTDSYDYFLIRMELPEGIDWNDDILFEDAQAVGQDYGCVANFVSDPPEEDGVLLEVQLFYPDEAAPAAGEVRVRLKNLIQTHKTEMMDHLVEGEWEIPLVLPSAEADTVCFYTDQAIPLGEHEILIAQADISPFMLRLHTEKEFALHAAWGHSIFLSGLRTQDGTFVEESGMAFSLSGHSDESGNFCFEFPLENAIDPEQISAIVIDDGGEERILSLNGDQILEGSAAREQRPVADAMKTDQKISGLHLLYVKYDHVVLADDSSIYLWDALCGGIKELFSLDENDFSWEKGGQVSLGQASQIVILPYAGSTEVYMYNIASQEMLTLAASSFWPLPTHESYLANCKDITEVLPEADEKYSAEAFSSQGKWYYLYSEDGFVQNMELRSRE